MQPDLQERTDHDGHQHQHPIDTNGILHNCRPNEDGFRGIGNDAAHYRDHTAKGYLRRLQGRLICRSADDAGDAHIPGKGIQNDLQSPAKKPLDKVLHLLHQRIPHSGIHHCHRQEYVDPRHQNIGNTATEDRIKKSRCGIKCRCRSASTLRSQCGGHYRHQHFPVFAQLRYRFIPQSDQAVGIIHQKSCYCDHTYKIHRCFAFSFITFQHRQDQRRAKQGSAKPHAAAKIRSQFPYGNGDHIPQALRKIVRLIRQILLGAVRRIRSRDFGG